MFQLMNLHKTEYRQQAFHIKIHQLTTNRILFHIHLHHLEIEVLQVIYNQVYLLQYQIEQDHPKKHIYLYIYIIVCIFLYNVIFI